MVQQRMGRLLNQGRRAPGLRRRSAILLGASAMMCAAIGSPVLSAPPTPPGSAPQQQEPAHARQPNILVIVADDLGYQDVGFNGAAFATPNIDRIARNGVVLDHFYTSALCSPSRAGLLTGRYPNRFGIMGDTVTPGSDFGLDPKEETIADVLARAGYARRSFLGKWHLGHRSRAFHPMNFGFTSFYGHYNGAIDYFTHKREGQVDWHRDYAPSADKGYSTDLLAAEATRIIRTPSPGGSPWFMWLAFNAPHGPLQAPPADLAWAGFDPSKPRFALRESKREGAGYGAQGRGNTHRQTAIAAIHALDRNIGAVLDTLRQTGQLDNTLILFTSDNGGPGRTGGKDNAASNGPLRGWKAQHYEGGVRVAAAISWPAGLKPRPDADIGPVSYVDLLPTLAHIAGATPSRAVDGKDMSTALLSDQRPAGERTLFVGEDYRTPPKYGNRFPGNPAMLRARAGSVIVGRWKLVGDQLFDLATDPYEKTDVAAQHADVVKQLKAQVATFSALRKVSRDRLNATHFAPIPLWTLPKD
ncbi:MAG TPA: sulfatase-like hydrolase/transferase [Sphingomonas sp.]|nr:sulfatase-like hydrolase/transferase [Sphingomonas sp.]